MILNYLMNHLHPVKIGSSRAGRKLFYNLKKARRELIRRGHANPTPQLIAEYLDVDEKEVVRVAAQLDAPPVFLDAQAPGHEKTTIGELMQSDSVDPETVVGKGEFQSQLLSVMKEFSEQMVDDRERAIWAERMVAEDPKSLVELGNEWGVSKERIPTSRSSNPREVQKVPDQPNGREHSGRFPRRVYLKLTPLQ